ncbi:hypothetical protein BC939DRAFT_454365 [Gamsiella multidivaricata]|uniref:uncharacterized protein n=1 Tax=Gamsiella multidivaricata TaxID=101098 RepID=UPI00221EBD34|nr:uncharacterized protein BC939DRAFT_454365 [Gamsiella multidivaricata]KAI7821966.1 hypothetical protein BC939DRAFT_454365 [Gamsiella multidivaricata]
MSPMSPTSSQNNAPGFQQQLQQQQQQLGYSNAPPPSTPQALHYTASGSTASASASAPPPPQLFWTQRRILGLNPFPRFQHTGSVTSTGTDIFVFGGNQRGVPKDDLFVIDTVSLECQAVAPASADPPMPKSGHSAVNIGQYIIYFGGWDQTTGQCDDSLHVLHTARKEWNKPLIQAPLPTPRHSHSGCSVGTTMYIFGGQVDDHYLGDIVSFDMKTITHNPRWEFIEPQTESPPARSGHCTAVYDGKIYIFGGADADYFYNDIWCFDTRVNTWTPIPASGYLPTGRHGHACVIVDGVLYVFGGTSPDGTELNDAYAFRIHERRWYIFQNTGSAASPRSGHTMCTIKDRIYVLGGDTQQGLGDDSAMIHYLEIPKIRFPDASQTIPPRQVSSAKLIPNRPGAGSPQPSQQQQGDIPSDVDSDRNSGQSQTPNRPDRPDRPARPDRSLTQRPTSPATFATVDRQVSAANPNISQQTSQLMNPQLGQRPLTTMGAPPPRGASVAHDQQSEHISIAMRRQTFKEDANSGYGASGAGNTSPTANRRTMQAMPGAPPSNGANSPSSLRLNNSSEVSYLPNRGEMSPTTTRHERRAVNGLSPAAPASSRKEDEVNPYAMDVIAASQDTQGNGSETYVPPPPLSAGTRQNLPQAPTTPSPLVSGQISMPASGSMPPPGSQGITNRSPSPATGRAYSRVANTPPPHLTSAAGASQAESGSTAPANMAIQEAYSRLEQQMKERDDELALLRKRENWLVAEVMLARQMSGSEFQQHQQAHLNDKRLSMADLEKEIADYQLDGHQLKVAEALLKVKEELRNAKMSIATQAQAASLKIKEAERIRTGALQEAAYLKAKLSSMSNAQQDPGALARVEMERASDLEKRLTFALGEMEVLEAQYAKSQESLQQEKLARLAAEERSNGASVLAEQAQTAHTRALAELASLHARASKAEAESRECATQLAESQAGFSGHQSQSSGLLQRITDLKQQVEEHQTALERTQMAYSAANERAMRAEALCDESSGKLEKLEALRSELASELGRYRGEAERLQSKAEELENRWQISKDEVITLRKLVEDGLGAFNPRGKPAQSAERKHDSIAILNTVSKVSELEHELSSLKVLHKNSQASASKSAAELADAMIDLSRLEQSSMKAKAESISLQKQLAGVREGNAELMNELSKVEQELENKVKEVENNEVQLGLLKDVMREKGIIAEDIMLQAAVRGSGDYAASMEAKVKRTEEHAKSLEQELEETREHFTQQMETFEAQRQATVQHSEKTGLLLRKMKNDLATTLKEKETAEANLRQLQETHARCSELSQSRGVDGRRQEDERVQMLQLHWDEERGDLTAQISGLQNRLAEAESHSADLSRKVISLTERIEEVETLNEAISEQVETMQEQADAFKAKATAQEAQLKSDVERLVNEVHQAQEMVQAKQRELENAFTLNEQLATQLDHALQAQAAAVSASSGKGGAGSEATLAVFAQQRQDLEQRLKQAQESIQVLEGDNSVLEARLLESEKKVALLLENMQSSVSNPTSPLNSSNFTGFHQQLSQQLARGVSQSNAALNSAVGPHSSSSAHHHPSSTNQHFNNAVRSSSSPRAGSRNGNRPSGSSPSGLQIQKKNSPSPNQYTNTDDLYNYTGSPQNSGGGQYTDGLRNEDEDINSRLYRDSVDSITRELELLKVPWNKGNAASSSGTTSGAEGGRKSASPLRRQQEQPRQEQSRQEQPRQQQQQYGNYYGNNTGAGGANRYMYDDEDDEEVGVSYLAHLQPRTSTYQQQQKTVDTHSFNDRSPSRLKEYEQMIDEIENARKQQ